MHIQMSLRITKGNNFNRIDPQPLPFIVNFRMLYMNVFARFDEIQLRTLEEIKKKPSGRVFTSNFSLAKINCHRNFGKVFAFTHSNEKLKRKCVAESLLTYFVT